MTTDALLAILLGVAFPFVLAVIGGWLAVKALPNAKQGERYIWFSVLIVICLLGIGLSFWQQVRSTNVQKTVEEAEHAKELKLEGENRYTQGQLDSINKVLTSVVSNSGGASQKEFIRALLTATALAGGKPQAPVGLKGLSNKDLRDRVYEIAGKIDIIERQYEEQSSPEGGRIDPELATAHEGQSFAMIRPEAQIVYEELLSRLPSEASPSSTLDMDSVKTRLAMETGQLAGAYPLRSVSAYLRKLATLLTLSASRPSPGH
jgi:hypothetical protein